MSERDQGHLKPRLKPVRGFESAVLADVMARRDALIRNLWNSFSTLTDSVPLPLRLATASTRLATTT